MVYAGSKSFMIPIFKTFEEQLNDKKIYCEPFIGSGACYLNTTNYDKYIINDKSKYIVRIYESFKAVTDFTQLKQIENNFLKEFGKIDLCKECYYKFRDCVNSLWDVDPLRSGIGLWMLSNSTINGLFRTGPNGFNSSYGKRQVTINETNFDNIRSKLKNTEIYNTDWKDLIDFNNKEVFYFFDPPYYVEGNGGVGYGFTKENYLEFMEILKKLDENNIPFLYTDVLKPENSIFKNIQIRKYLTIAPNIKKNDNKVKDERLFLSSNFQVQETKKLF